MFMDLQGQMMAKLTTNRRHIHHPTSKGDATEQNWIEMFRDYLPKRYGVEKAFVIDWRGHISEQIDVVIFDQQYSPFLFNQDGTLYVPAESVYAVFEVKPLLTRQVLAYAGKKAQSVRNLARTSAAIPFAAGKYKPKKPYPIIAGMLAGGSGWRQPLSSLLPAALQDLSVRQRIDLGCVLGTAAFEANYRLKSPRVDFSKPSDSLIFFFLRLFRRLQLLGTALAIDVTKYGSTL